MKPFTPKCFIEYSLILLLLLVAFGAYADDDLKNEVKNQRHRMYMEKSKSARNEALVVKFYNLVFNKRADLEKTAKRFLPEDYIQHNAFVGTGRENFINAIGSLLDSNPDMKYEIKHVITDGDLVILYVHMHIPGDDSPGEAIMEMLRVEEDKIVEHWDVQQPIPEFIPHDNGMF